MSIVTDEDFGRGVDDESWARVARAWKQWLAVAESQLTLADGRIVVRQPPTVEGGK